MTQNCMKNKAVWKEIDLSDKEIFENIGNNDDGIAMFGFPSLFFWKDRYNTSFTVINGNVVARGISDSGRCVVYFPRGLNCQVEETLKTVVSDCENGITFMPLTEKVALQIKNVFPDAEPKLLEEKCEYVYNQSDLSLLAGKKYHSKRNHIAKFTKAYDAEYLNINENNLDILRECAKHLYNTIENSPKDEFDSINRAIDLFSELELRACVIKVDGNYVAYSIGSSINADTADIHFEKADRSYDGSYAFVNNQFAKHGFYDKKYLNREEDLGIEGLRKAKLSYYPCRLNKMYSIKL